MISYNPHHLTLVYAIIIDMAELSKDVQYFALIHIDLELGRRINKWNHSWAWVF
jgi:hypothetical protein